MTTAHGNCGFVALCAMAIGCGLAGCSRHEPPQTAATSSATTLRQSKVAGPVAIEVDLTPAKARLADTLKLQLRIRSEPEMKIAKPALGDAIGDFDVLNISENLPTSEDGKIVTSWTYDIEPRNLGKRPVGPFDFRFTDSRPGGNNREIVVHVEALVPEIVAEADASKPNIAEAGKLEGPLPIDPPGLSPGALVGIGVLCLAFFAAAFFMIRYRRPVEVDESPMPGDLAAQEFLALERAGWIDSDPKRFYLELTGIVRRYIERTTNIHAPEQTTEEFLRECERNPVIPWTRRDRLREFLEAADLVKFAAVRPLKPAMIESLQIGRRLVDQGAAASNGEGRKAVA